MHGKNSISMKEAIRGLQSLVKVGWQDDSQTNRHRKKSAYAHNGLFHPKDSVLIMFRDPELANSVISFSEGYLAGPNFGIQGSRGAAAMPSYAT